MTREDSEEFVHLQNDRIRKGVEHLQAIARYTTISPHLENFIRDALQTKPGDGYRFSPLLESLWLESTGEYTFFTSTHLYRAKTEYTPGTPGALVLAVCVPLGGCTLTVSSGDNPYSFLHYDGRDHLIRFHPTKMARLIDLIHTEGGSVGPATTTRAEPILPRKRPSLSLAALTTALKESMDAKGWTVKDLAKASLQSEYTCNRVLGGWADMKFSNVLAIINALDLGED